EGAATLSWYAWSAGSLGATRSGDCTTLMPSRGSENEPCPCICVTATYRFQYSSCWPSPVNVTLWMPAKPYAGGITVGPFKPSKLNRGSYRPAPHEL